MSRFAQAIVRFSLPKPAEIGRQFYDWVISQGPWWTASVVVHLVIVLVLGLVLGSMTIVETLSDAPQFDTVVDDPPPAPEITPFEVGETPLDPTVLDTESLLINEAPQITQTEQYNDDSPEFTERGGGFANVVADTGGGLGGFDFDANHDGPAVRGKGGVGIGKGAGNTAGMGGDGSGFGGRGTGMRKAMLGSGGGTKQTERAVAAALNWIARHQSANGSWSLNHYNQRCRDRTCTGPGSQQADSAATALALLPFLAAGQTHKSKGPYQHAIYSGLAWLVGNQLEDGNLGPRQSMYSHGLATIALCEAYGLTEDEYVGRAAQMAIHYIEHAQHAGGGGWRYQPGQEGDTSVVGWQVMALKSAQMAGLEVNTQVLEGAKKFLKSASAGKSGGLFCYQPGTGPTPTMSAVGLLCSQYLGVKRKDPLMLEGVDLLVHQLPVPESRNTYYWYYATQVMHNLPGPDWDTWNRRMRRVLIESQMKDGCAMGSWDPEKPAKDAWGDAGGRLMVTSLSCLTLEVYYRYLPLYKLEEKDALDE